MSQEKAITAVRLLLPDGFNPRLQVWLSASGVKVGSGARLQYVAYGRSADGQKPLVVSVVSVGRVDQQSVQAVVAWACEWFRVNQGITGASAPNLVAAAR